MMSRRSFSIFAALAVGLFVAEAKSQTPPTTGGTLVYWRNVTVEPNPSIHYRIPPGGGAANAQFQVYPTKTTSPSWFSSYPFGRQFVADAPMDPVFDIIPNTNSVMRVPLLMPEQASDYAPVIGVFFGPNEFIESTDPLWSNDGADTFLTFSALDPFVGFRILYRFDGPISDLFGPEFDATSLFFNPFVEGDPRLTQVVFFPLDASPVGWDRTGTKVMFQQPAPFGSLTRIWDTNTLTISTINDPGVSGFTLSSPVYSPTQDRIFAIAQTTSGTRGIASFFPGTGAFSWVIQEGGFDATAISNFKGPVVSPDGLNLAFTLLRVTRVGTRTGIAPTLARIPVTGGTFTPLWTAGLSPVNNFEPTGWKFANGESPDFPFPPSAPRNGGGFLASPP